MKGLPWATRFAYCLCTNSTFQTELRKEASFAYLARKGRTSLSWQVKHFAHDAVLRIRRSTLDLFARSGRLRAPVKYFGFEEAALTRSRAHSLAHAPTHPLTHSLTHSITYLTNAVEYIKQGPAWQKAFLAFWDIQSFNVLALGH